MSPATVFQIHLVLGYVPWLLCFAAYVWPWLESLDPVEAHRAIATLHSFRFFGLVFIVPGVVGAGLPADFARKATLKNVAHLVDTRKSSPSLPSGACCCSASLALALWGYPRARALAA
jgi:hypothetical protein